MRIVLVLIMRMIIILFNIFTLRIKKMGRFVLVIVSSFVAFFSFAEEVTIEVVEIIGSQEDAKEIAGSASVIT